MRRFIACLFVLTLLANPVGSAVVSAIPVTSTGVNLCTTLTGNVDTTNTMDRGYTLGGPTLLKVVSTVGGSPTVTVNIVGSMDGTNFNNIPYSLIATPNTFVLTAITITSATTNYYVLQGAQPWRFLKLVFSANTAVTLTVDAFPAWP